MRLKHMNSPITGSKMNLIEEYKSITIGNRIFQVLLYTYQCKDTKEQFTTTELDEINIQRINKLTTP